MFCGTASPTDIHCWIVSTIHEEEAHLGLVRLTAITSALTSCALRACRGIADEASGIHFPTEALFDQNVNFQDCDY